MVALFAVLTILNMVCAVLDFTGGYYGWGGFSLVSALLCASCFVSEVRKS
jgi:hypothetical protein